MAYIVNNCYFTGCAATDDGGGIHIESSDDVHITNCEITGCTSTDDGAGISIDGSTGALNITIEDCYIHDNASSSVGGGIYNNLGVVEIKNSRIIKNTASTSAAGIYTATDEGNFTKITNCVIAQGNGSYGGVVCYEASASGAYLTNCTIADNSGIGVYRSGSGEVFVTNCILWGNDTETSGTMTITYSDVEGGAAGTGNVNDNPHFLATGKHEYSLAEISSAVDAANSGATYYETTDLLGAPRYDHPDQANNGAGGVAYADMGAYEFQGTPINTFDYSSYFLNLNSASGTAPYYLYAIVRLPAVPQNFGGLTWTPDKNTRHQISSEIRINDITNDLTEYVTVDNHIVAKRVSVNTTYATPTRSVDYETDYQSSGDAHVAEEIQSPTGISLGPTGGLDENYRYVLITMAWETDDVAYTGNEILIFNVDIEQIQDDTHDFDDFFQCIHPGATLFGPDVPLSAFEIHALQDSLLKILYESRGAFSIPLFGRYAVPVV